MTATTVALMLALVVGWIYSVFRSDAGGRVPRFEDGCTGFAVTVILAVILSVILEASQVEWFVPVSVGSGVVGALATCAIMLRISRTND